MSLNGFLNIINNKNIMVNLYMVHKVQKKNKQGHKIIKYNIVNPLIQGTLPQSLRTIVKSEILKYQPYPVVKYNPVGSNNGEVEMDKVQNYSSLNNIKLAINNIKPNQKFTFKNDDFDFFIYFFSDGKNNIFAFKKVRNFKVFKKGIIGHLVQGVFNQLKNSDMLATDDRVDFIMDNSDIYIFNHFSFERILDLSNIFLVNAQNVLSNKALSNGITNFKQLKSAALSNQSYIKRLAKLGTNNNSTLFLKNINVTKDVIKDFNLDIEVDNQNKLVYRDSSQISSFIGLMQDAYYKTLIGKREGMDKRG